MDERIKTPRGSFKIGFDSMKEANESGYYLWFEHDGYKIVGNGTRACAIRKEG
jgi:hypothetical protein